MSDQRPAVPRDRDRLVALDRAHVWHLYTQMHITAMATEQDIGYLVDALCAVTQEIGPA